MDLVSPVVDVFNRVWDCTVKRTDPIRHLRENLQSLEEAKRELEAISRDVESSVSQIEEQQHSRRTNQVKEWLETVDRTFKEVEDTLQRGDQEIKKRCLGNWCPKNCCSTYKLGKEVIQKLTAVKELISKRRDFHVLADKLPPAAVDVRPMEKTVGTESRFSQLWRFVQDHSVGIIGIFGMGGVGKTTLLKKLNNKFMDTNHDFDLVIWVVVSKEVNLLKIQEVIRKKVEISDDMWKQMDNEDDRATELYKRLSNRKFVLLLDDIWQRIDLSRVGVPVSDKCKIVFTTRSEDVCTHMKAHERFKVECVSSDDAWELFQQNLERDVLNSHGIRKLAETVVDECKGLPLALLTIGRAMANRKTIGEWQHAINVLRSYPSEFPGMGDTVLPTLKFSYDSLSSDILKNCFIYCSIYPEDHVIDEDELIDLWIGEGFLRDIENIYDARNEGKYIIGSLKLACLLETGETDSKYFGKCYVKMHDVLRDMALWIASTQKSQILVQEYVELSEAKSSMAKWTEARRISLWRLNIEAFTESLSCPYLPTTTTLLVRDNYFVRFPNNFFRSMCALIVLDLSRNKQLIELPAEIGELLNLQYLNLSFIGIKTLPIEVKKLRQLRILRFEETLDLQNIPAGVISCLSSLQVFYWFSRSSHEAHHVDISLLLELEGLEYIKDISLMLCSLDCIDKLFSSPKLKACVTSLRIRCPEEECSSLILDISSSTMKRMKILQIIGCNSLKELRFHGTEDDHEMPNNLPSLESLYLSKFPIKDLTWLIHVPSLSVLEIGECPSLTEVIACDFGSSEIKEAIDIFPNLEDMALIHLPNMKSICRQTMSFPSLKNMDIWDCPNLRNLPFNSETVKTSCLNVIRASGEWWHQLEWGDEATKHHFTSKFKEVRGIRFGI